MFDVPSPEHSTLAEAEGFGADIARIAEQYLNFTPVLKFTAGFGSALPNGSWNGNVGALQRRVSLSKY